MTVLTSETRLIGTGLALLPRVNLLPPEIAEKRTFRRVQMGLGTAVLASLGVVGLLVVSAGHSVASANEELSAATAKNASLQSEAAKYKNVTAIYAQAAAAETQLTKAMGDEVRYSQLLNDLSLSVPSNVWLKNVTFSQTLPLAAAGPAGPAASSAAATNPDVIGTFTVSGVGFSHDDVAVWLESVAGLKSYNSPYFSSSQEVLLGKKETVNFTSTANLTTKAFSHRYNKPVGG